MAVVLAVVAALAVVVGGYALVLVPGLVVLIGALLVEQARRTERHNAAVGARLSHGELLAAQARARRVKQQLRRPAGPRPARRPGEW